MFLQCQAINLAEGSSGNLMLVMKGITATFALIYRSLGKWGKRGILSPQKLSAQTHPKKEEKINPKTKKKTLVMKKMCFFCH